MTDGYSAVEVVTEPGALHVVTAIGDPGLHVPGFRPAGAGGLALRTGGGSAR